MNESTTTTTASTSPTATVTGKKRKIRQDRWEQNRKKLKRNSGKSYASQSGNKIPRKKFRHTTDCCKKNCSSSFDYKRQREIFKTFWAMAEKPSQDTFLISCIQGEEIKYVKTVTKRKNRSWSWKYSFKVDGQDKTVCKGFFLSLLQITESRMKTVLRFCKSGTTVATEKRGKQPNPAKISNVVWSLVKEHWSTFPNKKSHYGSSKTERKYFENPDLNVKKMFHAFQEYYFDKTGKQLSLKYPTYHRYFRENSDYSFRQRKTDVCDFCTECKIKLSANSSDPCKESFRLHEVKVAEYKVLRQQCTKNINDDTLTVEFDYAQNLPLPKLNVSAQFYKRLLWLYVFNTHCFNDGDSKFFCFLECDGGKNGNSVCSFLNDFLVKKLTENPELKKVVLLSDSCGGQNKNKTLVRYCAWLSVKMGVEINHIFPVRGHSYCQCDRNFGVYGTVLKKVETVENPIEYLEIMRTVRHKPKAFEAEMSAHLLKEWDKTLDSFFLKVPKAKGKKFTIQKYVKLSYKPTGTMSVYADYNGAPQNFNLFKLNAFVSKDTELALANPAPVGIKTAKKNDVLSLMPFVKPVNREWYKNVLRGTCNDNDSAETDEMDSD
ncbi:uncharacterized protein [Neodiprion pinetum]|uniref:uncharacterized protein n=1 Tax=Neodiprion pinetum TaxID=441929 RepID=UPI001EDD3347|nr:uncharacterized protein LOC124213651 [Neodiprion pinetum]XP_046484615.1 uncharacterized protein LOC124220159 [Neodiprion pinetum]